VAVKESAESAGTKNVKQQLEESVKKGKDGELQSGIDPQAPKKSIDVDGQKRVPDQLDDTARTLTEVKNTQYQPYTRQLRDMAEWAKREGYEFLLKVRTDARLSKPLLEAEKRGEVVIERCIK
jgi:hypothetical protein